MTDCHAVFGRAFLSEDYAHTKHNTPPAVDPSELNPGIKGSVMIYRFPTIEAAWARLKADVYWMDNVWDKEKVTVHEFAEGPTDDTMRIA